MFSILTFWVWCANLFTAVVHASPASAVVAPGCFSLDQPRTFLGPIPQEGTPKSGTGWAGGKDPSKMGHWGVTAKILPASLETLLAKFESPYAIKNPKSQKVTVTRPEPSVRLPTLERFEVWNVVMHPVFFLTVEWNEEWFFDRLSPKKMLISYQKRDGTSHIRHLCGNLLIEEVAPNKSLFVMYEEIEADYRKAEDTLESEKDTLDHFLDLDRKNFPEMPKRQENQK